MRGRRVSASDYGLDMVDVESRLSGALTDVGINDHFMKELAATLSPGSSTLFVLVRKATTDRDWVLEDLKGTGGKNLEDLTRPRGRS